VATVRTEREGLSPSDRASRDRRIARYIKSSMSIRDVMRLCRATSDEVHAACRQNGVATPRVGSKP